MDTVNKARRNKSVTKSIRVSARLSVKKSPSKGTVAGSDEESSLNALGNSVDENSGSLDKIIQESECDEDMQETLNKNDGFSQENTESIHEISSNDEFQQKDIDVAVDAQQKHEDLFPQAGNETRALSCTKVIDLKKNDFDFSSEDSLSKRKQDLAISVAQVKEESPNKMVDEGQDSAMEVDQYQRKYHIVIDLQNLDFDLVDLITSAFGMMSSSRTEDSSKATMTYSERTDAILAARVLGRLQLGATRLSVQCSLIVEDNHCDHLEKEQDLMTKVSEILSAEEKSYTWHQDSIGAAGTLVEANLQDDMDSSLMKKAAIVPTLETSKRPREEEEDSEHDQQVTAHEKRSRYERSTMEKNTEQQELKCNKESIGDVDEDDEQPEGIDFGLDIDDVGVDFDNNYEDMFDYEYSDEEIDKEQTKLAKMLMENNDKSLETLGMEDAIANPHHKESVDSISITTNNLKMPELSNNVKMVNLLLKSVDDAPLLDLFVKHIAAIKIFFVESFHPMEKGWQLAVPKCYAAEIQAVLDGCRLLDCTLAASLDTEEDLSRDSWDHFLPVREQLKASVRDYNQKQLRKYVNPFIYSRSMDPLTYKTMICNSKKCHANDCMFSHYPAELRQPVVYRSDNGRNISLYKSPNGKYNKNIITNFFSKICEHATLSGECSVFTFCRNSHPDSPDMFFHRSWKDLYVKGLNKSLPFLAGAIRNLTVNNARKMSPKKDKKQQQKNNQSCSVLFITQSLEGADVARQAVQYLCNLHCQPITINIEKPSSERTPVVIATVSQVLSALVRNSSLFASFKCLILDDASALLDGDSAAMLPYFFSRLWTARRDPDAVNKVVVCSKVQLDEVARMEALLSTTFNIKSSVPIIDKYLPSKALEVPGNSKALELQNLDMARKSTCDLNAKKIREIGIVPYTEASSGNEQATHRRTPKGIPAVPNIGGLSRGLSNRLGHVEAPFLRRAPMNGEETLRGKAKRGRGRQERTRGSRRDRSLLTLDHRARDRDFSLHAEYDVSGMDYDHSLRMEHDRFMDRDYSLHPDHLSRSADRSHLSNANTFRDGSSDCNRAADGPAVSSAYNSVDRHAKEGLLPAERVVAAKRAPTDRLRDHAGELIRNVQESFRHELENDARNVESRRPRVLLPTPGLHLEHASSSRLDQRQQAIEVEQATLRKRQQAIEVEQATLRRLEEHQLLSSQQAQAQLVRREELISRREIPSSPWAQLPLTIKDRMRESELPESHSHYNDQTTLHSALYDPTGYDKAPVVERRTSQSQNRRVDNKQSPSHPQLNSLRSIDRSLVERPQQWQLDAAALHLVSLSSDRGSYARKPTPLATLPSQRRSQQWRLDTEALPFAPSDRGSRRLDAEAVPFFHAPFDREPHFRKPTPSAPPKRSQQGQLDAEALPPSPSNRGSRKLDAEAVPFFPAPSDREPLVRKSTPSAAPSLQRKRSNVAASAGASCSATGGRSTSGLQAMLNSLVSASHAVPAVGPAVEAIALAAGNYGQNTRKALDLLAEADHVCLLKTFMSQLAEINKRESTSNGIYESTLVYGKGLLSLIKKHVVL